MERRKVEEIAEYDGQDVTAIHYVTSPLPTRQMGRSPPHVGPSQVVNVPVSFLIPLLLLLRPSALPATRLRLHPNSASLFRTLKSYIDISQLILAPSPYSVVTPSLILASAFFAMGVSTLVKRPDFTARKTAFRHGRTSVKANRSPNPN